MLERIEKYRILDEIGQGGMSVVYRGHDEALDRDVAVKVLHRHLARDPDARERFSREAKAVARLTHHNIPEIYDFSAAGGDLSYLVTELVEGASLAELVREGPPMLPEIGAMIVVGVAEALEHAHAHSVIHRDVKPENILVGEDGVAKLTDFGIAQIVGLESMTITGTLVGSPAHMSPEQIEGAVELDYRADIWALGTVLYVTSTGGMLPFDSATPHGILKKIVEGRYEDPRRLNPHVESGLAAIIARCLQVDRDARFQSVSELADALRDWLSARGLDDLETELREWMADPQGYQEDLEDQLAGALMERGEAESRAGRRHAALEAYGRVLTLRPDHAEAARRVRELNSGLRRRQLLGVAAGIAGIVGAVVLAWAAWPPPPAPPAPVAAQALRPMVVPPGTPPLEPPPTTAGRGAGAALAAAAARLPAPAPPAVAVERPPRPGNSVPPRATPVPVRVSVEPPAVRISVDGADVEPGAELMLSPGRHAVVLTHPACPDCEPNRRSLDVPAEQGERPLRGHFRYEYESATILVTCVAGEVAIDGKVYGPCGRKYLVPVLSHTPRVGQIRVTLRDGRTVQRPYTLKPKANVRWSVE